jgi:hypothetical protein
MVTYLYAWNPIDVRCMHGTNGMPTVQDPCNTCYCVPAVHTFQEHARTGTTSTHPNFWYGSQQQAAG